MKYIILSLFALVIISGCGKQDSAIVKLQDIQHYLMVDNNRNSGDLEKDNININFWSGRLKEHPGDTFFKQMLTAGLESRYKQNGNINDLLEADSLLVEADKEYRSGEVSILQALSQNAISRHQFKLAVEYGRKAFALTESRVTSSLILTDALMETGNYTEAEALLKRYKDDNSLSYLIRKSRFFQHLGNLDSAIAVMNNVNQMAKDENNITMICYSDNLIGIYSIEAGSMHQAYDSYLDALRSNPYYVPALEGIAAIALLNDKNSEIAKDIYESLSQTLASPDPYLNLYKIAKYNNDETKKQEYLNTFYRMAQNPQYGRMYNKYLLNIEAEEFKNFEKAKTIAESEIQERPTPASYFLLAWAYFQNGDNDRSIQIIKDKVEGKTTDPEILSKIDRIFLEQTKKM